MTPLPEDVRALFTPPFQAFPNVVLDANGVRVVAHMRPTHCHFVLVDPSAPPTPEPPLPIEPCWEQPYRCRRAVRWSFFDGSGRGPAWHAWFRENVPAAATLTDVAAALNDAWKAEP